MSDQPLENPVGVCDACGHLTTNRADLEQRCYAPHPDETKCHGRFREVGAVKLDSPRCPYCEVQPLVIKGKELTFPSGAIALMFYCANPKCLKLFTVAPYSDPPKDKESRIVRPS